MMILLVVLISFWKYEHITRGHVLPSVSHFLVTLQLLTLEKQIKGI
jgi:hypothetical protein